MPRSLAQAIILLSILFQTAFAQSSAVLLIDSARHFSHIDQYLQLCETELASPGPEDFFERLDTNCFHSSVAPEELLGQNYIGKLSLHSTSDRPLNLVLIFGRSDLLIRSALVDKELGVTYKSAGLFFKRSERDMKDGNMTQIALHLRPHTSYQLYFHIHKHFSNINQGLNLDLQLLSQAQWQESMFQKRTFQGMYAGLICMMIVVGIFFLNQSKRPEYLFYVLFQLTSLLNFIALEDFLGAYVFPESPFWRATLAESPALGLGVFYLLFIRYFLETVRHSPTWDRIFRLSSGISVLLFGVGVLFGFTLFDSFFALVGIYVGVCILLACGSSIVFFREEPSQLRSYVLIGSSILFVGYVINGLNMGLQFFRFDGMYIIYLASFIEALVFAAGLAYKHALLEQEKDILAEVSQMKSRLYTNITHEFRTPLTIILGISRQLKDQIVEKSAEQLAMIQRNGQRLLQLINQLLDLSKLESGKLELHLIQADVVNYLKYLTESFHSIAEYQAVHLHFLSDLDEFVGEFDPERLQQIFFNLISNALKFTPEGGNIYIQVSLQDKKMLELKIRDTGAGIAEKDLNHIFDRFYQVDHGINHNAEGSGIGLALVKELVSLMEGKIKVKSKTGKGTEFILLMPIKQNDILSPVSLEEIQPPTINVPKHAQQAPLLPESPLVLLIEDNEDVLQYLTYSLSNQYQLIMARDGEEGIQKALKHVPDLIISDVMMPIKDGLEVCKKLKQDRRTSHIPLILLTAKADIQSRLQGLEHGADVYLAKPFHEDELLLTLNNLLHQRNRLRDHYQFISDLSDQSKDSHLKEHQFVKQVRSVILTHLTDHSFTVAQLSKEVALSTSQLHRKLKALTGYSAIQLIRMIRLNKARQLLLNPGVNIATVAYDCGFSDPDYFSKVFKKEFGLSPSQFKQKESSSEELTS